MSEHTLLLYTLWLVSSGFLLKGIVFGTASGIMVRQHGTSKLANAVKWFFIVMTVQDIIFSILYGAAAYDAIDTTRPDLSPLWISSARISGIIAIYAVGCVGSYFIWVLSRRVRVLIEYEEVDGTMEPVKQNSLRRRSNTRYEGEADGS